MQLGIELRSPRPLPNTLPTKNYKAIILTAIAANVYNILLFNYIWPEVEKILRSNHNGM